MVDQSDRDLRKILEDAIQQTRRLSGVRSITVARRDGLVIVHQVESGQDPLAAAAMAAATVGSAAAAAKELRQGTVDRVIIECSVGKMIVVGAGAEAIILALYDREANLGLAVHALTQAARVIDEILREHGLTGVQEKGIPTRRTQ